MKLPGFLNVRVKKTNDPKYFYALDKHDSRIVRFTALLGLLSLGFVIAGYVNFLRISPWIDIIFAPLFLLIVLYYLIQYGLLVQYPGFDIAEHRKRVAWFKQRARYSGGYPNVAVLIPAAGEDLDIIRETLLTAQAIDYPSFQVFMLDDSREAVYAEISSEIGVGYIRRPNVGHHQKSGNLNYALQTLEGYDWFLVLDADFKARPEMLYEMVPYAASDVSIVQTPQHFPLTEEVYKRSKIEYGAALIQQDFYRLLQVARNTFGAAICVGTNALYNVEALKKVGGFEGVNAKRGWGHSEDVYTGLKTIHEYNAAGKRYHIEYLPVQLAEGYCPDKHHSFYKQQNRWCTGSVQLLFTRKTLFSAMHTTPQRIIYASNALYYYYTIAMLGMPLYLLVLTLIDRPSAWRYTALFLPALVTNLIITPFLLRREYKPLAIGLVTLSNAYTFLHAVLLLHRKRPLGWVATGIQGGARSTHFTQFKLIATLTFTFMYVPAFGAIVLDDNVLLGPNICILAAFFAAFILHLLFLYYILIVNGNRAQRFADRKFYAAIAVAVAVMAVAAAGVSFHGKYIVEFSKKSVVAFVPARLNISVASAHSQ